MLKDGYRVFVQTNFPNVPVPAPIEYVGGTGRFYKDAAHALSTLSRNWDRKALIAKAIWPGPGYGLKNQRVGNKQTMGFTPVISCHEAWYGGDWCSRNQVVAWGAGAEVVFGSSNLARPSSPGADERELPYHWRDFSVYREKGMCEGLDDVTFVQTMQSSGTDTENLLIGRASGHLTRVSFEAQRRRFKRRAKYDTFKQPIKSATLNSEGILAACLSKNSFALYDCRSEEPNLGPMTHMNLRPSEESSITRVAKFLRDDLVAVGYGPSAASIQILNIGDCNVREEGLISYGQSISIATDHGEQRKSTSVYSFATLPPSNQAGGKHGELFLSGGYDGVVRLHDLRCANRIAATFSDLVDSSAIYSLVSYGRERFVAGAARDTLMKVFDLRVPGSRRYFATDLQPHGSTNNDIQNVACGSLRYYSPEDDLEGGFVAGIFPDPVFGKVPNTQNRVKDIQRKWDPRGSVARLPLYQHPANDRKSVQIKTQRSVGYYDDRLPGWDERWEP
ncbi:uncharacterized protein KY384_004300 [Bacidia gigantensis]|uniref:uncharacterized protein n=1 Tax=Bacidia gigantensis TaxID=2732470 RepID=UPI001D04CDC0|nr:uncharacterized protein KY384_004300 [Bacidia gigantensis]KAG8530943.1 hypothetical protein KY384_004300 [Bacidia gigantensis]